MLAFVFASAVTLSLLCIRQQWRQTRALEGALAQALHAQQTQQQAWDAQWGQARVEFASVLSHEIRTPLSGIVGLVALAQDPRLDEAGRRHYLQLLSQSSQSLANLVSQRLDSQGEQDQAQDLRIEPFSLAAWSRDLDHSFRASAAMKGLFLTVELEAGTADGALGDAARLRQIAAHFIARAIHDTQAGSIHLQISRPWNNDRLRLAVRDSGFGLNAAKVNRTDRGLTLCERLAHKMNGQVGHDCRAGVGSVFWAEVEVPVADCISELSLRPQPGPIRRSIDLVAARVLVVDDNAISRTVTQQMLRRMNAVVATAQDAQEGLDAMRQATREGWPFDAVLMDVRMPGMSGLDAVQIIRTEPALATTPVLALTAGVLQDDYNRAMAAGMDGFLSKPVSADQLARSVAHFADRGRQQRSTPSFVQF